MAIAVAAVPPFRRPPVATPVHGIAFPLREFLLHVAAPVECAVPSPVPTVPRAARAAVAPDGVAAPVRITALVAIAMAAHYLPISPSNAAYVKTRPPPRVRAPRDAFATLVEPEESGGRRRGVIQRGRLKVRCDGSVGSVWVFVALSRVTRASEPAVVPTALTAHAPTKMRLSSFLFSQPVLAGLSAITKCAYRYRYQKPNRNQIYHLLSQQTVIKT